MPCRTRDHAPAGDFDVTTRVSIRADQDYEQAFLCLWQDHEHYTKLAIGLLLVVVAICSSDIYPRLYHEGRVIEPRGEDADSARSAACFLL